VEAIVHIVGRNIMELNKIELKKISHDFNIISSRIMRAKFDNYNLVLRKFLAFIDENEIIHTYVMLGDISGFDASSEYQQVTESRGKLVFDFGPTSEEETYQIYAILKHISDNDLDVSWGMMFQYAGIEKKRNEVIKEFNDRVVLVLIQSIEGYLTKIGYEMGMDEKMYWNVSGGQVNVASDNATINATQNNGIQSDELDRIVKAIMDNVSSVNKEDAETIKDSVNMIKDELLKSEPKRTIISNGIKLLAPMISIVNGIPTLTTNIQNLIDFASQFLRKI